MKRLFIPLLTFFPLILFAQPYTDGRALLQAVTAKTGASEQLFKSHATVQFDVEIKMESEMGGMTGNQHVTFKNYPDFGLATFKMDTPMGEMTQRVVKNKEKAWMESNMMGKQDLPAGTSQVYEIASMGALNIPDSLELVLAEDTWNEKPVYTLTYHATLQGQDGETINTEDILYIHRETLQLMHSKIITDEVIADTDYEDYQETEGVWIAHKVKITQSVMGSEQSITMVIKPFVFDEPVDDSLFTEQ